MSYYNENIKVHSTTVLGLEWEKSANINYSALYLGNNPLRPLHMKNIKKYYYIVLIKSSKQFIISQSPSGEVLPYA